MLTNALGKQATARYKMLHLTEKGHKLELLWVSQHTGVPYSNSTTQVVLLGAPAGASGPDGQALVQLSLINYYSMLVGMICNHFAPVYSKVKQ